jgi:hypothetical protein
MTSFTFNPGTKGRHRTYLVRFVPPLARPIPDSEEFRMPTYRLGRLQFSLSGLDPIVPYLHEEFAPFMVARTGEDHLRFDFIANVPEALGSIHDGALPLRIDTDGYAVQNSTTTCRVTEAGATLQAAIRSMDLPLVERAKVWASRTLAWRDLAPHGKVAADFIWANFNYLSQIAQLKAGQSYIHASGIERAGAGVAIVGGSRIGKTSTMLRLVQEDGWRYLGDDLIPVSEEGIISRGHEWVHLNGSNLIGKDWLRRRVLERDRHLLNRAAFLWRQWRYGAEGVWYRIAPEELFGPARVAKQARLHSVIFIERVDRADFSLTPISVEDASRRAATGLLRELEQLVNLSLALHSSARAPILPTVQSLLNGTERILSRSFASVRLLGLSVPLSVGPDEIADYISGILKHLPARESSPACGISR